MIKVQRNSKENKLDQSSRSEKNCRKSTHRASERHKERIFETVCQRICFKYKSEQCMMWCCKYTKKRKKDAVPGSRSEERAGASSGPATVRVPGSDAVPAEERKQIIWLPGPWKGSQFYFGARKCTVCSCRLKSVSGSKQQLNTETDDVMKQLITIYSMWLPGNHTGEVMRYSFIHISCECLC